MVEFLGRSGGFDLTALRRIIPIISYIGFESYATTIFATQVFPCVSARSLKESAETDIRHLKKALSI